MGEIELKFNFDTESRGALFAPRQGFTYTIFTPEPCESTARAQTGYIGDTPMLLFFAILWGAPKNCINKPFDKSKFETINDCAGNNLFYKVIMCKKTKKIHPMFRELH